MGQVRGARMTRFRTWLLTAVFAILLALSFSTLASADPGDLGWQGDPGDLGWQSDPGDLGW